MNNTNNIHGNENGSDQRLKDMFGKEIPYRVPEAYFEGLKSRVLETCKSNDTIVSQSTFLSGRYNWLAAAAAILLFAGSVLTIVFMNKQTEDLSLDEYSMSEIYRYSINSLADLEEVSIFSFIEDDSLKTIQFISDETENISDDIIIDYLLAENHIEYHIINEY